MTSYQEASNAAARAVLCSYFSVTDALGRAVRAIDERFAVPIPFVYDWFRRLCNEEPPPQPSLDPPTPSFTGGQCPFDYNVNVTLDFINTATGTSSGGFPQTFTVSPVRGPIQGLQWVTTDGGSNYNAILSFNGTSTSIGFVGPNAQANGLAPGIARINSNTPTSGGPDNCGDPTPDPVPPPPPFDSTTNTTITYTDNSNNSVDVDVQFVFGNFQVDVNGNLSIPFTLSFAPEFNISLNGSINQDGDVNISYGNPNYRPSNGCCQPNPDNVVADDDDPDPDPTVPVPTPPPPNDGTDDDPTAVIRAVIVTTTTIPDYQSIVYQDDNPDIMIPRLGNVQFLIAVGQKIAWSDDIPVRNRRHFIVCPWEGGAIDVRGTPAPGVEFSLTKVYAREQYPVELLV